jgi:hypothetical protein
MQPGSGQQPITPRAILGMKPVDPNAIHGLTPIDDHQSTKTYGVTENFSNWEMPDVTGRTAWAGRKYSGHMQQLFCKYRTGDGRIVWGEWWHMNISGMGGMHDDVAPGYKLNYNSKTRAYEPKVVQVQVDQFSQFFEAEQ